jgi:phosphonate transport system substrate-binding protein
MIDNGKIQKSQVKIVYQSDVIPRTTIGWFYNLKPDLAAKVRDAILAFAPGAPTTQPAADTETADSEAGSQLHFVAIDYRKDFELVRWIDDSFDPRFDAMVKQREASAGAQ